ncbi:glycosyl hydrolase [Streptomyces lycii]|uniref:Beta-mannanase n=1 Tax=Streptomyces lycii TaxID=2654337 RepID=A0ABQ7FMD9_9ACTN|nr:glycosyl hydrolase [Streptomyces lycii]KAF4410111.1 beta-mannanase [Streptomyces lycii]
MRFRTSPSGVLAASVACLLALSAAPPGAAAHPADTRAEAQVYEAETGALHGVTVGTSAAGYSGTGYVEGFDAADDSVTVTVPDSPGGLHDLTIHYRAPYGQKTASLQVNGQGAGDVTFTPTDTFSTAAAGRVLLEEGENTVTVLNNWGWYEIDAISLSPSEPRPPHQVSGAPVDPDAGPEARELLSDLTGNYGKNILSGQQDMASVQWLEDNVGASPAVAGLDMMDYSPSRVERGTSSTEVENALAWDERGGITTFVWHWNAPSGLIDEPGKEWWRGFYTDATTFDVAAAIADKQSPEYELLLRDIDAIAQELSRLQDAGVPVLWRPLHEAEGGWFWWGAKGPEPAKELWRIMYDRMVNHHGLHNLLWVWNSVDPAWYPGDDVVDIVSADSYPQQGDHGPVSGTYEKLVQLVGDEKLVALTETGSIPDPELLRTYEADWSWFTTWSGFSADEAYNPLEFVERVYRDEGVITLDELPDWRAGSGSGAPPGPGASPVSTVAPESDSSGREAAAREAGARR